MVSSPVAKRSRSEEDIIGVPELGVLFPRILLPEKGKVDLGKWAVVACDQYTSEEDYWERVEQLVSTSPSTLRLTFPEVYLEKGQDEEIISNINAAMKSYEAEGIFRETESHGVVLVERTLRSGVLRKGIVLALDLEEYSFKEGSESLIRATEKTIEARIPPRLRVRKDARIELPHIIVLVDDPEDSLVNSISDFCNETNCVYETDLMEKSGHIKGFWVDQQAALSRLSDAIKGLADQKKFAEKYGPNHAMMVFAMGDGNHSLATAKTLWEEIKKQAVVDGDLDSTLASHPARYALVEIENCQDPTLVFEPINRLVFNVPDNDQIFADLKSWFDESGQGPVVIAEGEDVYNEVLSGVVEGHVVAYMMNGRRGTITISNPKKVLPVASMTDFLDQWLDNHKEARIDYVHETTAIDRHCTEQEPQNVGFVFSSMNKSDLFRTVILDGVLPRKTFSMGNAHDKRFYFEARYIRP
jgi:hypothetical protein